MPVNGSCCTIDSKRPFLVWCKPIWLSIPEPLWFVTRKTEGSKWLLVLFCCSSIWLDIVRSLLQRIDWVTKRSNRISCAHSKTRVEFLKLLNDDKIVWNKVRIPKKCVCNLLHNLRNSKLFERPSQLFEIFWLLWVSSFIINRLTFHRSFSTLLTQN